MKHIIIEPYHNVGHHMRNQQSSYDQRNDDRGARCNDDHRTSSGAAAFIFLIYRPFLLLSSYVPVAEYIFEQALSFFFFFCRSVSSCMTLVLTIDSVLSPETSALQPAALSLSLWWIIIRFSMLSSILPFQTVSSSQKNNKSLRVAGAFFSF